MTTINFCDENDWIFNENWIILLKNNEGYAIVSSKNEEWKSNVTLKLYEDVKEIYMLMFNN